MDFLAREINQLKETRDTKFRNDVVKIPLFTNYIILYIENLKESTQELLE